MKWLRGTVEKFRLSRNRPLGQGFLVNMPQRQREEE